MPMLFFSFLRNFYWSQQSKNFQTEFHSLVVSNLKYEVEILVFSAFQNFHQADNPRFPSEKNILFLSSSKI